MKKLIAITSALAMMLVLASCGEEAAEVSSQTASTPNTTPSTNISIPVPSEPPAPAVDNNMAHKDYATYIDMNTGKEEGAEDYLAYYSGDTSLHLPELALDGNLATGWQIAADYEEQPYVEGDEIPEGWYQSDATIYKKQSFEDGALWFGIMFDEAKAVDVANFYWESGSLPAADGLRYEITLDGENWTALEDVEITRDDANSASYYTDIIALDSLEFMGIRAVITKCDTKYAPKLYEVELFAPEGAEEVESTEETESTDETVAE